MSYFDLKKQIQSGAPTGGGYFALKNQVKPMIDSLSQRQQEEARRKQEEERNRTMQDQLGQSLSDYEDATGGVRGWLNKFLGRGTSKPVLVGETPEYTAEREKSEADVSSGPVSRIAGGAKALGGALIEAQREVGQAVADVVNIPAQQRIVEQKNEEFREYLELSRETQNERMKDVYKNMASQVYQEALTEAEKVGGELKNKTNRQLLATAGEFALDVGTLGASKILTGATRLGMKGLGAVRDVSKARRAGELIGGATGMGAVYGATESQRQNMEDVGDIVKSTAVGGALGAGLGLGMLGLSKGATRLLEKKVVDRTKPLIEKEVGKLDADEASLLTEGIREGRTKDEIVAEIKQVREADDVLFKEMEEPKVLDDQGTDATSYVRERETKFRDVSNQDRDDFGRFTVDKDTLTDSQRGAIIDNIVEIEDVFQKAISKEGYKNSFLMDDWGEFKDIIKKIESGKITDRELMLSQNGIDEFRYKFPKITKLQEVAKTAPTVEDLAKHVEAEDLMPAEIQRIFDERDTFVPRKSQTAEVEKAVEDALGTLNKPKYRENIVGTFEKRTGQKISEETVEDIAKINERMFGDKEVKIVPQILTNYKALGEYQNNMIKVVRGDMAKDTLYHEAVHKYLDVFSTEAEYVKALEEARKKWDIKGTWADVEEELAERFIKFAKKEEEDMAGGFFEKLMTRFKKYFEEKDTVDKLYRDIFEGKAKETTKPKMAKATPKPKEKVVEGKKSKLAQRINENLPEEYKISEFYDEKTIKKELSKASEDIAKDKDKALREAFDKDTEPLQRITKLMEFAQIAKSNKDFNAQNALLSRMRKEGTETAQALNMFKAYELLNPETNFMKAVVNARIKKVAVGVSDIKKAREQVSKKITEIAKDVKKKTQKAYKVADAQELFNKLVC